MPTSRIRNPERGGRATTRAHAIYAYGELGLSCEVPCGGDCEAIDLDRFPGAQLDVAGLADIRRNAQGQFRIQLSFESHPRRVPSFADDSIGSFFRAHQPPRFEITTTTDQENTIIDNRQKSKQIAGRRVRRSQ